jgi:hypothetical protein
MVKSSQITEQDSRHAKGSRVLMERRALPSYASNPCITRVAISRKTVQNLESIPQDLPMAHPEHQIKADRRKTGHAELWSYNENCRRW